jgi:urocanate hydratase
MVREEVLSGPVAFTRDHLDAGAMAHPNIMTENMRDGSDAIADWPLLNARELSSQADLVAIHSGGGGYAGCYDQRGGNAHCRRVRWRRGAPSAPASPTTPRP